MIVAEEAALALLVVEGGIFPVDGPGRFSTGCKGSLCQELDSSWLTRCELDCVAVEQGVSDSVVRGSDESAKLKLDRGREGDLDCQERDKYKTEGKVQLLRDTYT